MKHIFKLTTLLLFMVALVFSCKKEELDIAALTDFPPGIASVTPGDGTKVNQADFNVVVKFISGSVSPLASASVKLLDAAGATLATSTETLSGTSDSIVIAGSTFNAATLPLGQYKIEISVTDTKGKTQVRTTAFEVFKLPSVGIIGSATPTGWNSDTDMLHVGDGNFEIVMTFVAGEAKFRADNDWAVNWGAASFPSGIGTQDGANIPVPAGTWKVTFNPGTGAYNFSTALTYASNVSGLYLLGSFNNFQGEDYGFNLVSNNTWVLDEILIKPGALFKFAEYPSFMGRNWGDDEPDGRADEFGKNISFANAAGEAFYKVTFNDKSLLYTFEFLRYPTIGIIGSATPGGWDTETQMTDKGNGNFEVTLDLVAGEAKFRANNSWDTNWGAGDFPSGIGTQNGPNIPVPAGRYKVTFNPGTGAYNFEVDAGFQNIGIIGSATPGGWDTETPLRNNGDGTFEIILGLKGGEAKFRANNSWDVNWGAIDFPLGIGTPGGANIPVPAGLYLIKFNSKTGEYSFQQTTVGIIGESTPGGWGADTDMAADAADYAVQKLTITLTGGGAKFRGNHDWKYNWGADAFPAGTGTQDGSNIPTTAGTYNVTFNVNTGEYKFE